MRPIRPYILVQVNPQDINKGQPVTISARLYDRDTNQPQIVSRIFLTIISLKDGHVVWNNEVIRKNNWKFDELIGTKDMKEGHQYEVRVSNNWNFSPMGATTFKIIKDATTPVILIPLIISISKQREFLQKEINKFNNQEDPLFPQEENIKKQLQDKLDDINKKKLRDPLDDVVKKKIKMYIWRTEMDKRVCTKYCLPLQNKIFLPHEELPEMPQHPQCRCHVEIVYKDQFDASFTNIQQIYQAAIQVKQQRRMNNIIKAITYIDEMIIQ